VSNPVTFSPDGKIILTRESNGNEVRMWDAATAMPIRRTLVHQGVVNSVAYSPDSKTILTGSSDKTARQWDAATGLPIGQPLAHQGEVSSVAYSPTARPSSPGLTRLCGFGIPLPAGPPDALFRHQGEVSSVAYSPDGRTILAESGDNLARLWDATTAEPIGKPLEHPGGVYAVAYSPDGKDDRHWGCGRDSTAVECSHRPTYRAVPWNIQGQAESQQISRKAGPMTLSCP